MRKTRKVEQLFTAPDIFSGTAKVLMRKIQERNTQYIKDYFRRFAAFSGDVSCFPGTFLAVTVHSDYIWLGALCCFRRSVPSRQPRECDTDGEPGLDAREISLLLQALGYLPDMACILFAAGSLHRKAESQGMQSPRHLGDNAAAGVGRP